VTRTPSRLAVPIAVSIAVSITVLGAAACASGSHATATDTGAPALAQVSTAAAPPPAAARPGSAGAKPGPAITAACPLLSPGLIASALGVRPPAATERPAVKTAGGTVFGCHYQSGGRYVELWVSVAARSGSADQAASLAIRRYTGTLNAVPHLGDAAYYTDSALSRSGPRPQGLVAARAEGRQMRVITLSTFLGGQPEDTIITLARAVLERI
jgi:hypothetical protein